MNNKTLHKVADLVANKDNETPEQRRERKVLTKKLARQLRRNKN